MRPLGLLLLCLAVVGCAPAYIEDLDRAAGLTRHLITVGTVGPVNSLIGNGEGSVRFFPAKPTVTSISALNVQSGFTVTEYSGSDNLQFAYTDSSGHVQLTSNQTFSLAGADPNYPLYQFEVTTTTSTANIIVLTLNPTSPSLSQGALYAATLPNGPLGSPVSEALSGVVAGSNALGVSVTPNPSTADTFSFLLSSPYADASAPVNSTPPPVFGSSSSSPNAGLSIPVNRSLYYRNQGGTLSYASYYSGGKWVCLKWQTAQLPVTLGGVTHRIDALLTSGDLLSTEGGVLTLYDQNGSQVMSVSLGGLQYCYEAYIGSTPYVFFSLTMKLGRNNNWAFRAYAVPTSSMRSLGG